MAGLDIKESSGSSQIRSDSSRTQQLEQQNPSASSISESTDQSSRNSLDVSNIISIEDFNPNSVDVIEIPLATPASKTTLQVELLRHQIEYTKRDIYHRELAILEKERSLSLTNEERERLRKNSGTLFEDRKPN